MQTVHQDHPDLAVVLRMSLSLRTALLMRHPNLPAAVGCLLGDVRVARRGIIVRWSVWSGALLFDILNSHKRLSGSSTPVTRGDTVAAWRHAPVASGWGAVTPMRSPPDPTRLVESGRLVHGGGAAVGSCFTGQRRRRRRRCCFSFVGFIPWAYAALINSRHSRHMTDSGSLLIRLIGTKHMCLYSAVTNTSHSRTLQQLF